MKENTVKGLVALMFAGAGAYFHELLAPVIVLGLVMLADYISGLARAWIGKTLSSRAGIVGIVKKIAYLFAVAVAVVVDWTIQNAAVKAGLDLGGFYMFGLLVTVWLILNECISILENLAVIGVPLPAFLMKAAAKLKQTAEETGEEAAGEEAAGNEKGEQHGKGD